MVPYCVVLSSGAGAVVDELIGYHSMPGDRGNFKGLWLPVATGRGELTGEVKVDLQYDTFDSAHEQSLNTSDTTAPPSTRDDSDSVPPTAATQRRRRRSISVAKAGAHVAAGQSPLRSPTAACTGNPTSDLLENAAQAESSETTDEVGSRRGPSWFVCMHASSQSVLSAYPPCG